MRGQAGLLGLSPRLPQHPAYVELLSLCARQPSRRVADVGAAFGQESRQLVLDGVSPSSLLIIDLPSGYWKAGVQLFGDSPTHGSLAGVATSFGDWAAEVSPLEDAYACSLDAVACMFVLHVLSREQQGALMARLHRCSKPGALLLGCCVGCDGSAGEWGSTPDGRGTPRWLHSAASLRVQLVTAGWAASGMGIHCRPRCLGECGGGGSSYVLQHDQGAMATLTFHAYA
jgi:SAM-dependent methyltransferase